MYTWTTQDRKIDSICSEDTFLTIKFSDDQVIGFGKTAKKAIFEALLNDKAFQEYLDKTDADE